MHESKQKGWEDSSQKVGYERGQISDEQYHTALAIHDPLWRYILRNYGKEERSYNGEFKKHYPVSVIGYNTYPVAIELSQWGYDITFITNNALEIEKAKKDNEIQAGNIKENFVLDYAQDIPGGAIACFIGIIDEIPKNAHILRFLGLLARRYKEIVFTVENNRDWRELLGKRFKINYELYPKGDYAFISLKQ